MTIAAQTPPLRFDTIEQAIDAVRRRGMRLSTARRLVLEALFAAEGPVSASHLAHALSIDESSVYRNLDVLERHGLIRHVHLGHGPGLYVLVGRHEVEYLYCERCAKVTVVPPEQLDSTRRQIREQFGHHARFTHFAIVGLCQQCAQRPGSQRNQDDPRSGAARLTGGADHGHQAPGGHEHLHSHGDHVHSHPHAHSPSPDPHRHRS